MSRTIRPLSARRLPAGAPSSSPFSLAAIIGRQTRSTRPYRVGWLLLVGLLIIGKAKAQVWTPQVSGTTQSLYSVWSRDASNLWTVGNNGTILHTTNGGLWTSQASGTSALLTSVWGSDVSTVWAAGDGGTILRTTNGGTTWTAQLSGTNQTLFGVWGARASTIWVVGNGVRILKTSAGGSSWQAQTSNTGQTLLGVWASDANMVWAVGATGTILKTTDGGATWTPQTSTTTQNLLGVWGADANTVWAVGTGGTILKTTNGGTTWLAQPSGTTQFLNGVRGRDANTLVAVGGSGTIIRTIDGGAIWTAQVSGTNQQLRGVHQAGNTSWAVGDLGTILNNADITLPVVLRYFNGRMTAAGAFLSWQTTAERNNASFRIQRSTDARSFETIGQLPSQAIGGEASTALTYSFTDPLPLPGVNYYRLLQLDQAGTATPSKIIALSQENQAPVLYPNPMGSQGAVVIEPALAFSRYELIDGAGRVRLQASGPGMLSHLSVGDLPAGVYVLWVQLQAGGRHLFRLVR